VSPTFTIGNVIGDPKFGRGKGALPLLNKKHQQKIGTGRLIKGRAALRLHWMIRTVPDEVPSFNRSKKNF
jgi:hypothetical protein